MTTKLYFLLMVSFFISCKPKPINETRSLSKVDTINNAIVESKEKEDFNAFFQKFKNDSLFQKQRIDNPLTVVIYEEDVEEVTKQQVKYVSFNQKDWDMKISIETEKISKDTVNVILEGIDTGVRIEHMFVNRNIEWHLFQIKNYSD